jgi:hypothetical protein
MYLTKKTYVKRWEHTEPEKLYTVDVLRGGKPVPHIKPERIKFVDEEVAYWRKANHIHKWFVDNVQEGKDDCQTSYVSSSKLQELLDVCKQVVETPDLAPELLPTQEGFFFGFTGYGEWYFDDVKETITMLDSILSEEGVETSDFEYHASW